jgi:hypothetical protein
MSAYRLSMRTGLVGLLLLAGSGFTPAAEIETGLPANTSAVVTVNLKQLLHAPVVKRHGLASLRQLCRDTEGIRTILETLGFDPFRDLDRLTVVGVGPVETGECLVILHGRFDTARFHLAAKMLVKEHNNRFVMHKDEKLKYISVVSTGGHGSIIFGARANSQNGAGLNVYTKGCLLDAFGDCCLALLDKNTLIAATSEKLLTETCQRIAHKDTSTLNKPMRRLLADLDGKQTILFASQPNGTVIDKSETADRGATRGGYSMPTLSASYFGENNSKAADSFAAPEPFTKLVPLPSLSSDLPPPPSPPGCSETREESRKPSWELSGSISLAEDFKLRCAVRTTNAADARLVMKGFDEVRLRADGLMTFLAGSNKEYAFLKELPRAFLAVRKGRIILVEGRLSPETIGKLLGTCSEKNR